tara:strand:+ start:103 stop:840 length:738 start_codon:yes stop_codon:yes gene_type:complete
MSVQKILTTSEKKLRSVAFGSEQAERPHSVQREVRDLREDVERAFEALESGTNAPEIHRHTLVADDSSDNVVGSIKGINLLAGRGVAKAVIGELTFFGLQGEAGNNVSITINTGAGLAVAVSGTDITITLAGGGSTSTAIKDAIDAHGGDNGANKLVAVSASGSSNVTAAVAKTLLTGGSGDGISLFMYLNNGTLVDLTTKIGSISDTEIVLDETTQASTAGHVYAFVLKSHTVRCAPILVTVQA